MQTSVPNPRDIIIRKNKTLNKGAKTPIKLIPKHKNKIN